MVLEFRKFKQTRTIYRLQTIAFLSFCLTPHIVKKIAPNTDALLFLGLAFWQKRIEF